MIINERPNANSVRNEKDLIPDDLEGMLMIYDLCSSQPAAGVR
jgi:hypothetical protein